MSHPLYKEADIKRRLLDIVRRPVDKINYTRETWRAAGRAARKFDLMTTKGDYVLTNINDLTNRSKVAVDTFTDRMKTFKIPKHTGKILAGLTAATIGTRIYRNLQEAAKNKVIADNFRYQLEQKKRKDKMRKTAQVANPSVMKKTLKSLLSSTAAKGALYGTAVSLGSILGTRAAVNIARKMDRAALREQWQRFIAQYPQFNTRENKQLFAAIAELHPTLVRHPILMKSTLESLMYQQGIATPEFIGRLTRSEADHQSALRGAYHQVADSISSIGRGVLDYASAIRKEMLFNELEEKNREYAQHYQNYEARLREKERELREREALLPLRTENLALQNERLKKELGIVT